MAPEDKKDGKNRILHKFDPVIWGLLKKEAKEQKRTPPRQLEEILAERYRADELTEEETAEALRIAATRDQRKKAGIEPTPKKVAKKQANGPRKNR